jgi:hypothetical protein
VIAFLRLNDLQELSQKAWHAPYNVDRRTRMQLVNPVNQHNRALQVPRSLKPHTDLVDEFVKVKLHIPACVM